MPFLHRFKEKKKAYSVITVVIVTVCLDGLPLLKKEISLNRAIQGRIHIAAVSVGALGT